jgi:hypothetical protein
LASDLASLAFLAGIAVLTLAALRERKAAHVRLPGPGDGISPLSIVVAARNEAPRIKELIESILAQDHPDYELIIVDDRSADGTGEVARSVTDGRSRVQILRVDQLPAGWQGRLYALSLGVEKARGEWLLFLSADQRLGRRDFLRSIISEYESRNLSAGTVFGRFEGSRWWQLALYLPIADNPVFVGCYYLCQRLQKQTKWLVGALAMRRQAYDEVGGARAAAAHGAGGLFDDWGWTRAFELADLPTVMVYDPSLRDVSNWDSFGAAWQGLTRWCLGIFVSRMGSLAVAALIVAATLLCNLATLHLAADLSALRIPSIAVTALSLVGPVIGAVHCRAHGYRAYWALLSAPVGLLICSLAAAAIWARVTNRLRWKGEEVRAALPGP